MNIIKYIIDIMSKSYIYCVTNEHYTNYVKVGETSRNLDYRLNELNTKTVTISDFKLEYYIEVSSSERFKIEKCIHNKIVEVGIEKIKNREFFKCNPNDIKKIFEEYNTIKYTVDNNEIDNNQIINNQINENINILNLKNNISYKYKCNRCNKEFIKKYNYHIHINRKNKCTNNKSYNCDRCNKEFLNKYNYYIHINRINKCTFNKSNKLFKYKCDRCNKEFIKKYNYNIHINRKFPCHKKQSKLNMDNKCNRCLKVFSQKSNLNKHIKNNKCKKLTELINNNKCPHCLKEFSQKSNVIKHIKNNSCKKMK